MSKEQKEPEFSKDEKDAIVKAASEAAGKCLLHAYVACDLKEKIETMLVNDYDGKEYVLTFYPVDEFQKRLQNKTVNPNQ